MKKFILPIIIVIAAISYFSIFVVKEINQAIVLQFGNPKQIISEPGLNFKIPFIQNVAFLDKRILNFIDVNDINNPNILASYDMISPRGMGLAGDFLFLCEGPFGLRTLNVSDPQAVEFLAFNESIHANDVIVLPEVLLVIGPDNITQFDYSDPTNLVKISEISIE